MMRRMAFAAPPILMLAPLLLALPAAAAPIDLVRQAVDAEGGVAALRGLQRLTIIGEAHFWEPDESRVVYGPPSDGGTGTMTIARDLAHGQVKTDWARDQRYPNQANAKYTETVTPETGFVTLPQTARAMSGIRVAASQRELERTSPLLLLKALQSPGSVTAAPDQRLGGARFKAVSFRDGRWTFLILFDGKTHLPVAIRTRDEDALHGDSVFDLLPSDWRPIDREKSGGAMVAHSWLYRLNDLPIEQITYRTVTADPDLSASLFAVPDGIRASVKEAAREPVPYQWVIRRVNSGFFNDSDGVSYDTGTSQGLTLKELAPDVQQVVGGTHNSLIVALKDYLVVVDAPIDESESLFTIHAAHTKYPGKKIRYLILTHHHNDHTGGVRTFMAEGAEIVVGSPNKSFFEKVAKTPHRLLPDRLQIHPRHVAVTEIADRRSFTDGSETVTAYRIDNPHAEGMLLIHVASKNLVFNTDLYAPGRDEAKNPNNVALRDALQTLGLDPAIHAGGHGGSGSREQFQQVMAK
jgi:glyoxylase-like metal-dependent hydrolase (beta-lactamase superfamily II)